MACYRQPSLVSLFLFFTFVIPVSVYGQWQQFRGPNGSGVTDARDLPAQIDAEANIEWRREIPPGHSSPVVHGDSIFVTALDEGLATICLDRQSGNMVWQNAIGTVETNVVDPRNHPASPTAAVDESGVYVFFPDFGLVAYTIDGDEIWQRELGPFNNIYGLGASPIIVADLVVLPIDQSTDSYLLAVDKRTGQQRWRTQRPEAKSGHSTPIVIDSGNEYPTLLLPGSFLLSAYDARDGRKLWWVGGLSFEMKSTPVIVDDLIFVNGYGSPANQPGRLIEIAPYVSMLEGHDSNANETLELDELEDRLHRGFFPAIDLNGDRSLDDEEWSFFRAAMKSENSMMAIRLGEGEGDLTDTHVVWKYHRNIPQLPSPISAGDWLYMIDDNGIATCFDPRTGEVRARDRLAGAHGDYYSSPVAADGKVYFISLEGKTATLADDGTLTPIANGDLKERCYATPAIAGRQIFVRTAQALYSFRHLNND